MPRPDPAGAADPASLKVLSPTAIWLAAALIVLVGAGVATWLLLAYGNGGDQARNQLDAIKTAGTAVVGTGGAAALLLAARRQRATEIALRQKDRETAVTERDATERRITELYTSAAEQLGSDRAPVRLAGLYALERLAQNTVEQRQTIVNVLCAYLRMPYRPPDDDAPDVPDDLPDEQWDAQRERLEEREVRLTAQRILTNHLRTTAEPETRFWSDMDLDLTGAQLINVDFKRCRMRTGRFNHACFTGRAEFAGAQFGGNAWFAGVEFRSAAQFDEVEFGRTASFVGARFRGRVGFAAVRFDGEAVFAGAVFADTVPQSIIDAEGRGAAP